MEPEKRYSPWLRLVGEKDFHPGVVFSSHNNSDGSRGSSGSYLHISNSLSCSTSVVGMKFPVTFSKTRCWNSAPAHL